MYLVPLRGEEGPRKPILARAFLLVKSHHCILHLYYGEWCYKCFPHAGLHNGWGMPPHLLATASGVGGWLLLLLKKCSLEVSGYPHNLLLARANVPLCRRETPDLVPYCPLAMGLEELSAHLVTLPSLVG